jgi:secreted trypsin-like serine protease
MRTASKPTALLVALAATLLLTATPAGVASADPAPSPRPDPRIVGGTVAPDGAWPTQVALVDRTRPSTAAGQFCGGTVIARTWILTAAHCLRIPGEWMPTASQVDVLVGTGSLSSGGTRIRAVELRTHTRWDPNRLRYDVGLIRLDRPVPSSTPLQPYGTLDISSSMPVTAVGWGSLDDPPTRFPTQLRQVDMEIQPGHVCAITAAWDGRTQFCAYATGKGVCFGDSGGPILVEQDGEWIQVGISSYVLECGRYPSYFTRVSAFLPWIRAQIRYGPHPDAAAFVRRQHLDLFGRPPTNTELFSGVAGLDDQPTATYVAERLEGATFRARAGGVIRLYRAIFLREPDSGGLTYWMGEANRGVSLKRIADQMVRAPEFTTLYGALDDGGFVDLVYDNVLDRAPSTGDRDYWVGELAAGRRTRGQVMVGFSESAEYRTLTDPSSRVTAAFWALLRRVPSDAETVQWTGRPTAEVVRFLLDSYTYANRF